MAINYYYYEYNNVKLLCIILMTTAAAFSGARRHKESPTTTTIPCSDFVRRTCCNKTTYPTLCLTSLCSRSNAIKSSPKILAEAALSATLDATRSVAATMKHDVDGSVSNNTMIKDCLEVLDDSVEELKGSISEMSRIDDEDNGYVPPGQGQQLGFRIHMSNVQTWVSAALTDDSTCTDSKTTYPSRCYSTMCRRSNAIQDSPKVLADTALTVTLTTTRSVVATLSSLVISNSEKTEGRARARDRAGARALGDCLEVLGDSVEELSASASEMKRMDDNNNNTPLHQLRMNNVQTWVSAALTDASTCTDGFDAIINGELKKVVRVMISAVAELTSNALALINTYAADTTTY